MSQVLMPPSATAEMIRAAQRREYEIMCPGVNPTSHTWQGANAVTIAKIYAAMVEARPQGDASPSLAASLKCAAVEEQAEAWRAVCALMTELRPGWAVEQKSGLESVLDSIRALAQKPAVTPQARPDGGEVAVIDSVSDRYGQNYEWADAKLRTYNFYAPEVGDKLYLHPAPAPDVARLVEEMDQELEMFGAGAVAQLPTETLRDWRNRLAPFTAAQQGATNGQE